MAVLAALGLGALGLAGCSGRSDDRDAGRAPIDPATAASGTDGSVDRTAPTPPEGPGTPTTRSLRLEQSGWRFDVDARTTDDRSRVDVLVRTATVGAAPERLGLEFDGAIVEGFATDLDGDAAPELLLWTRSAGSSAEGEVRGWRFAADGANVPLALPALDDDLAIGWRGRDQLGIQGRHLVRSFPLYRDADDNASPSAGFVRVVRYRLEADGFAVEDSALEPMDGTPQAEVLAR
jgi:hypothetical protein